MTIVSRCQACGARRVGVAAPEVDDQLAVDHHGGRGADVAAHGEVLRERRAHRLEPRVAGALHVDHVRSPRGGLAPLPIERHSSRSSTLPRRYAEPASEPDASSRRRCLRLPGAWAGVVVVGRCAVLPYSKGQCSAGAPKPGHAASGGNIMRLAQPRIEPVSQDEYQPSTRRSSRTLPETTEVLTVTRTLARHPALLKARRPQQQHLNTNPTIPLRHHELVVLRIGWLCQAEYEFSQHTVFGKRAGLTDDEITRITEGPDAPGWAPFEATLLRTVDELYRTTASPTRPGTPSPTVHRAADHGPDHAHWAVLDGLRLPQLHGRAIGSGEAALSALSAARSSRWACNEPTDAVYRAARPGSTGRRSPRGSHGRPHTWCRRRIPTDGCSVRKRRWGPVARPSPD